MIGLWFLFGFWLGTVWRDTEQDHKPRVMVMYRHFDESVRK